VVFELFLAETMAGLLSRWHWHCDRMVMQNTISQLFNDVLPQTLGLTDPVSILGVSLVAPGVAMFVIIFFARELFRPRWRGYWDAV
jgi:hypothetical protein